MSTKRKKCEDASSVDEFRVKRQTLNVQVFRFPNEIRTLIAKYVGCDIAYELQIITDNVETMNWINLENIDVIPIYVIEKNFNRRLKRIITECAHKILA